MNQLLDPGPCVNGHPLGPFRLETVLGEDGTPTQVWMTECRALITVGQGRSQVIEACGSRVYVELVPAAAFT